MVARALLGFSGGFLLAQVEQGMHTFSNYFPNFEIQFMIVTQMLCSALCARRSYPQVWTIVRWPSSAQHNEISTTQRIGIISLCCDLILLCCANFVVLRLVYTALCCNLFPLCCDLFTLFCDLFTFFCAHFVEMQLVSVVLWWFCCVVHHWATLQ